MRGKAAARRSGLQLGKAIRAKLGKIGEIPHTQNKKTSRIATAPAFLIKGAVGVYSLPVRYNSLERLFSSLISS